MKFIELLADALMMLALGFCILLLLILATQHARAEYGAKVVDQYGNTVHYIAKDDEKARVTDKFGETTHYINKDGKVTNQYGERQYYIKQRK